MAAVFSVSTEWFPCGSGPPSPRSSPGRCDGIIWDSGGWLIACLMYAPRIGALTAKKGSTKDPAAGGRPTTASAVRAGDCAAARPIFIIHNALLRIIIL